MSEYKSGFAGYLDSFVKHRKASDKWNKSDARNLHYFDKYCVADYEDNSRLTQEMVDGWCTPRETETGNSTYKRVYITCAFVDFLRARGLTDISTPEVGNVKSQKYIPHAFTEEELGIFFKACDNLSIYNGTLACKLKKIQIPVLFRLLYSSGIRTTEARLLKRKDVDLEHGVLNIQQSKGHDQHYIALDRGMNELLMEYNTAADKLQPERTYFFQSAEGTYHCAQWISNCFRELWKASAGNREPAVPYDFRHNYAIENILSWENDSFACIEKLHYLSKSMGHHNVESTLYYYSIVPRLADKLKDKTELGFNEIIPEVWNENE